jgi:recombination protein RecA
VIFINQIRMKIGVMYGNPETTTGGNALKFYASVRLEVRRGTTLKEGEGGAASGTHVRVKVVKNKMAPPFKEAEFDLTYGEGINKMGEIVDLAGTCGVLEKSGSWYGYAGERLGQGKEQAMAYLAEHPDVYAAVADAVLAKYGLAGRAVPPAGNGATTNA